jgi:hypothetical protein
MCGVRRGNGNETSHFSIGQGTSQVLLSNKNYLKNHELNFQQ